MRLFPRPARTAAFVEDESGASMIEFALFAPILAMMVMGITDFAMGYAAKIQVEQAVYRSLEKVAVGSIQSDYDYLRAEAAAVDGSGGIQADNVTVDRWLECDRARQAEFNGTCATGQSRARYVSVTVNYAYTPRFDYGPLVTNADGVFPMSSTTSLRIQ